MKAARFAYERPSDLGSALALLAEAGGAAKIIAGGQSLGPMLNLRLVQPDVLVDIAGLPELREAAMDGDELVIGACVTHADIEDGRVPDVTRGAMRRVAGAVAYRAVRNRGTIGGSLSHADPSADWISALAALGARAELRGPGGTRMMAVAEVMRGPFEAALEPGEMVVAVRVPRLAPSARWGYAKSCRKTGEFAQAIGAVLVDPERGTARAVIGAVEAPPIVLADASGLFGGRVDGGFARSFDAQAADAVLARHGMADAVDRHIHVAVLRRAVMEAGT
jgi:aerobic carbon-monoxide dehydrogenase medium subunit